MSLRERDRTGKVSREGKNSLKIGTLESDSPGFKSQPGQLAVVCRGRVSQTGSLPSLGPPSPSDPPGKTVSAPSQDCAHSPLPGLSKGTEENNNCFTNSHAHSQ